MAEQADKTTDEILQERGQQHGNFTDNAAYAQALKTLVKNCANWDRMSPVQKESMEMILHKIARIMAGNHRHKDHWDDIAGYARLVSQRLV